MSALMFIIVGIVFSAAFEILFLAIYLAKSSFGWQSTLYITIFLEIIAIGLGLIGIGCCLIGIFI